MLKHSLVIPCYNEQDNIEAFFTAACEAMRGYTDDFELVFVNDGSRDATAERLDALYAAHKDTCITVIHFSRNFGKEAAMYAGLIHARGEYVTLIDADLQQHPLVAVEMGRLLDAQADVDMVAAFPQKRHEESPLLAWCKSTFYRVINRISEVELIADASDFRTMRRNVVDALVNLSEYHRFSKGLFSFVGFRSCAIPYEVHERLTGTSKWSFFKLMRYALDGIIAYSDFPLRLPLYAGGGMAVCGIVGLLGAWIADMVAHIGSSAWALGAWMLILCGIILVCIGVQGMYIGNIHTQVKQRPVYIVRDVHTYTKQEGFD